MNYEIEVNVARKGCEPVWRPLVDDNDDPFRWTDAAKAREVLVEEDRGDNARLMRYDNSGIGRPWP